MSRDSYAGGWYSPGGGGYDDLPGTGDSDDDSGSSSDTSVEDAFEDTWDQHDVDTGSTGDDDEDDGLANDDSGSSDSGDSTSYPQDRDSPLGDENEEGGDPWTDSIFDEDVDWSIGDTTGDGDSTGGIDNGSESESALPTVGMNNAFEKIREELTTSGSSDSGSGATPQLNDTGVAVTIAALVVAYTWASD